MSEYFWIEKLKDKPKYKLGQNFLIDTNISRKITKLVQGQLADPIIEVGPCLLYTSPSPRDRSLSRMPSSA